MSKPLVEDNLVGSIAIGVNNVGSRLGGPRTLGSRPHEHQLSLLPRIEAVFPLDLFESTLLLDQDRFLPRQRNLAKRRAHEDDSSPET